MKIVVSVLFFILALFSFSHSYHCNCQNDFCQCQYNIYDFWSSYRCECKSPNLCVCTDGVTSVTAVLPVSNLILDPGEATQICPKDFLDCKSVPWRGKICALTEFCIADVARVVSVNFPFLAVDMIENAEKTASAYMQKSMSLTDSVRYFLSTIFSSIGISSESSSVQSLMKGKMLTAMKKQAQSLKTDLSSYFFSQIVRDFAHETQRLADYFFVSRVLQDLYYTNKLSDFISFYFIISPIIKKNPIFERKLFFIYNILSNSTRTLTHEELCSQLLNNEYEKSTKFMLELKKEVESIIKKQMTLNWTELLMKLCMKN